MSDRADKDPGGELRNGLLVVKAREDYVVEENDGARLRCVLSNRLRKDLEFESAGGGLRKRVRNVREITGVDPVAVGDRVAYVHAGDGTGVIREVLPRVNHISRRTAGKRPQEQIFAANLDAFVTVHSVTDPSPRWNLVDRYIVCGEAARLPVAICMTKSDLGVPDDVAVELDVYREIGYTVFLTSIETGEGIEDLKAFLSTHRTVFAGSSGVGKTSLMMALIPGLTRQTQEISDRTGKGKHTTRHVEMYTLPNGGRIVDTPGMREFALWMDEDDDPIRYFPEIYAHFGKCRFGASCSHRNDPGCAVRAAVDAGLVSERRYHSCLKLQSEL